MLVALFWYVFYQNLPASLHGVPIKPLDTAGTIDRFAKLLSIGISIAVIAARWSLVRKLSSTTNFGLVGMMVLIPMSAVWSIDSNATLLRFVTLACIVLLCFAISLAGWDRFRLQQVALPPIVLILVSSLVIGVVSPQIVIEVGDDISLKDAWHGITHSKNLFGMAASTGFLIFLNRCLAGGGRIASSVVGAAIALVCLLLSRSNTSLFATLLGAFFMIVVMRIPFIRQRYTTHVVIAVGATILVYQLAIQQLIPGVGLLLEPIAKLTGKDLTFSARTVIWDIIKEHSSGAPWLGTGYGAYWTGPNPSSPSYIFVYLMYFYPTEAHNGYLEIVNDLGRVGLMCLILYLAWYAWQGLKLMQFDRSQATLYLGLLYQQMVLNMSESDWFSRSSTCAVLTLATTCMARALLEHRSALQRAGAGGPRLHKHAKGWSTPHTQTHAGGFQHIRPARPGVLGESGQAG